MYMLIQTTKGSFKITQGQKFFHGEHYVTKKNVEYNLCCILKLSRIHDKATSEIFVFN